MLNSQYSLSVDDISQLDKLKDTDVYRAYLNSIMSSPIHKVLMSKYIDNVDISGDIDGMTLNASNINKLFKHAVSRIIVNMVADATILNELASIKIDDVKNNLEDDFKVQYLLGLADDEQYEKAKSLLASTKDIGSVVYKGFVEWYKRKHNLDTVTPELINTEIEKAPSKPKRVQPKSSSIKSSSGGIDIDISEQHIRL